MQARIRGSVKVFFYDTEAGLTEVHEVYARPRALSKDPYMLEVSSSVLKSNILLADFTLYSVDLCCLAHMYFIAGSDMQLWRRQQAL